MRQRKERELEMLGPSKTTGDESVEFISSDVKRGIMAAIIAAGFVNRSTIFLNTPENRKTIKDWVTELEKDLGNE